MEQRKTNAISTLISGSITVLSFIAFFASANYYSRALERVDFLEQAQQAATVGAARDALERGMPWVEKHFAGKSELRIWQSNLDYLKEQPQQDLIPYQIKESLADNTDDIYSYIQPGSFWLIVSLVSIAGVVFFGWLTAKQILIL